MEKIENIMWGVGGWGDEVVSDFCVFFYEI